MKTQISQGYVSIVCKKNPDLDIPILSSEKNIHNRPVFRAPRCRPTRMLTRAFVLLVILYPYNRTFKTDGNTDAISVRILYNRLQCTNNTEVNIGQSNYLHKNDDLQKDDDRSIEKYLL